MSSSWASLPRRRRRRWHLVAATTAALATTFPVWAASGSTVVPAGCDGSLSAVAHHPQGQPAGSGANATLVPCLSIVGPSTETATVGVARSGRVFFAPLIDFTMTPSALLGLPCTAVCPDLSAPAIVAHTQDGGRTWSAQGPYTTPSHSAIITWMHVDPTTSRVWMANVHDFGCGAIISWSDDLGATWTTNPSAGCPSQGGMSVFEGPAPRGQPRPTGYAHVVYYCGNMVDGGPNLLFCYRSLDGGTTFSFVGSFPNVIPPPASCQASPTSLTRPRGRGVGPDGTIYMSVDMCGALGVGVSRDEGASWDVHPIVTTPIVDMNVASLAVDQGGNVFLAWEGAGNQAYVVSSTDQGRTWSAPENVTAPGAQQVRHVAIAATGTGHVAVAYLGSTDGGATFTGYLTESFHALTGDPLLWSAPVTGPNRPLMTAAQAASSTFGGRTWFVTAAFAPDGTPYAGFHCAVFTSCPASGGRQGAAGSWTGVVAQLATVTSPK